MKTSIFYALFLVFPLTALLGCGSSDQAVDPGDAGPAGQVITVVFEGHISPIPLSKLPTSPYKGQDMVSLKDVWYASSQISADDLFFEAESSDGFRPSMKGADCLPLSGKNLDHGFINPTSRNVVWDEALGLRGCFNVKDAAKLLVTAKAASADAGQ